MSRNAQLGPTMWAAYVRALAAGHGARAFTIRELADRFEISIATSRLWMKALHDNNCVFIQRWGLHSKAWVPYYAWGFGEHDMAHPPLKTKKSVREKRAAQMREKKRLARIAEQAAITQQVEAALCEW